MCQWKLELHDFYPDIREEDSIAYILYHTTELTGNQFVAIIDEWNSPLRDSACTTKIQKEYLEFLRSLFKSSSVTDKVFAAAYMTVILQINMNAAVAEQIQKEGNIFQTGSIALYLLCCKKEEQTICEMCSLL